MHRSAFESMLSLSGLSPNPALERTRGKRPRLRNDLRYARAAQRER
jgi:hypothetical protein